MTQRGGASSANTRRVRVSSQSCWRSSFSPALSRGVRSSGDSSSSPATASAATTVSKGKPRASRYSASTGKGRAGSSASVIVCGSQA